MRNGEKDTDFRELFENAPGLYLVLDAGFRIVAVTDAYLKATLTERSAILGRHIFDVFPDNPDDPAADGVRNLRESLERAVATCRPDAMAVQKYDIRTPDGAGFEERFWSPLNTPICRPDGSISYIIHRVEDVTDFVRLTSEGNRMEAEIYRRSTELGDSNRRLRGANDQLERLYNRISDLVAKIDSQAGASLARLSPEQMLTRVTTLIADQKRLEEQLRHSQKMEAIGLLAGGVAHDFNNLLTVISGFAHLALEDLKPGFPAEAVKEVEKAARRAADLTRQLLAFSRKQPAVPRLLDLSEVIGGMEGLLRRLIGENITLVTVTSGKPGKVNADPGQIEQIVMNLAINARDAMPEGGRLVIETGSAELDAEQATHGAGPYTVISVSDTGHGMDEATVERIFEPFFTTKGQGKGTGLGLSTVYGIVEQNGGTLNVETSPGKGATFRVFLPVAVKGAVHAPAAHHSAAADMHTATILVVEDEPALRGLIVMVLRNAGYEVLEAANGEEALIRAKQHPGHVDVLLTDVLMPGMTGIELMDRLRKLRPQLNVLFMSGYDRELIARRERERGVGFLPKPFSPQTLLSVLRKRFVDGLESAFEDYSETA